MNARSFKTDALQVNQANEHFCAPDWKWSPNNLHDLDIWLVCAGAGTGWINGRQYCLRRGSCFLFRPGVSGTIEHDPSNPFHVLAVHFQGWTGNMPQLYRNVGEVDFLEKLLQNLISAYHRSSYASAQIWLAAALESVLEIEEVYEKSDNDGADIYTSRLRNLRDKIRRQPEYPWSVGELAVRLAVSPDHFTRLFKAATGLSPSQFIIAARIDKAKQLLCSSSHPLERIAELCGFNSPQFFSRQFREKTGISPSRFRQF